MPRPRRWNWTNGWLVCTQKSARLLDLDCPLPPDASSGRLCRWGSEQKDVSTVMGGHSRQLSCWSLLHGFLGRVSGSDPEGTAHSRRLARPEKPLMWSGGRTPCGSVWLKMRRTSTPSSAWSPGSARPIHNTGADQGHCSAGCPTRTGPLRTLPATGLFRS